MDLDVEHYFYQVTYEMKFSASDNWVIKQVIIKNKVKGALPLEANFDVEFKNLIMKMEHTTFQELRIHEIIRLDDVTLKQKLNNDRDWY